MNIYITKNTKNIDNNNNNFIKRRRDFKKVDHIVEAVLTSNNSLINGSHKLL